MSHNPHRHDWDCECGCGCCGNHACHCDSDSFDSDCTDEGQAFPLSIPVGCEAPEVSLPLLQNFRARWSGLYWLISFNTDSDTDSS